MLKPNEEVLNYLRSFASGEIYSHGRFLVMKGKHTDFRIFAAALVPVAALVDTNVAQRLTASIAALLAEEL